MAPTSRSVLLAGGADLNAVKEKLQAAINTWRAETDISFVFDETYPEEAGITRHQWWAPSQPKELNLFLVRDEKAGVTYVSVDTTVKKLRDQVLALVAKEFPTQDEGTLLAQAQQSPPPAHAFLRLALALQAAPTKKVVDVFAAGLAAADAATREDAAEAAAATQSSKLLPALRAALAKEKNAALKKKLKLAIQLCLSSGQNQHRGGDES